MALVWVSSFKRSSNKIHFAFLSPAIKYINQLPIWFPLQFPVSCSHASSLNHHDLASPSISVQAFPVSLLKRDVSPFLESSLHWLSLCFIPLLTSSHGYHLQCINFYLRPIFKLNHHLRSSYSSCEIRTTWNILKFEFRIKFLGGKR